MPARLLGAPKRGQRESNLRNVNFDSSYSHLYPEGINLHPGTRLHDKLKDELLLRADESSKKMRGRYPAWEKVDKTLTAFIQPDKDEQALQDKDPRKPISIVVPESYATLEIMLTYALAAFGTSPMFRIEGQGPEDVIGAILLEKTIEYQMESTRALLPLHTQWRDSFSYGVGATTIIWTTRTGKRSFFKDLGFVDPSTGQFVITGKEKVREPTILYEGCEIFSLDPYKILPDPEVNLHDVQGGEFFGWTDSVTYAVQFRKENEPGSIFFNTKYLRHMGDTRSTLFRVEASGRNENTLASIRNLSSGTVSQPVDRLWMYWDLIPKEQELGPSENMEKWLFCLAGDEVIIAAHPMDLDHNMFPVALCAPDFGGHEFMPIGRMEIISGYQTILNFLINSHIHNVRKNLRHTFIVDPKRVRYEDVLEGKDIIRTHQRNWGRGVKDAIEQIKQTDITAGNLGDLGTIQQLSRGSSGAVDSLLGLQRQGGERVTKSEFETTRAGALSRLQKAGRIISLQSMIPIGTMCAYLTQQFMTEERFVRVAGRTEYDLRTIYGVTDDFIRVTPFDISIAFDVTIQDGSTVGGENVDALFTIYQAILQNPEAAQEIDTVRMLLHMARVAGVKNPNDFIKNTPVVNAQVLSDEQTMDQVEAGNLIPLETASV